MATMSDGLAVPDDDSSDAQSQSTIDSCEAYINFESIRDPSTQLEEGISFSWPGIYENDDDKSSSDVAPSSSSSSLELAEENNEKKLRKIVLSTLLEEEDLAPLFDGSRWAGTRLWGAAVRAIQYISGHLPDDGASLGDLQGVDDRILLLKSSNNHLLELGCGLGVPGMIYHLMGGNVVLTDQADILSQMEKNVADNFPDTCVNSSNDGNNETSSTLEEESTAACCIEEKTHTIRAMPLSWSRNGVGSLLEQLGRSNVGFDIVLNCDCVYEPLYGKSWHLLNETIDELLKVNPQSVVISSMERRQADGIDLFLEEMRMMEHVGTVDKVWEDEGRKIEIYVARGNI